MDDADTYQLYDVLVRFYMYARRHNINVERSGVEGLACVTDVQGLADQSAECIDVTTSPFLAALKIVHPTAEVVEVGESVYLVVTCS